MAARARSKATRKASPRRPPTAVGLDHKQVVEGALALIDAEGLGAFGIRSLARHLGVNPAAVQWHAGSRDQLLTAVIDEVAGRRSPVDPGHAWPVRFREVARALRRTLFAHPNLAPLIGGALTSNRGDQDAAMEEVLSILHEAGLRGRALADQVTAVTGAVLGFIAMELSAAPTEDVEDFREAVRERVASVDADAHPRLARTMPHLANRSFVYRWDRGSDAPLDDAFERLLDTLVAGIERS
ncbi:MAG: TetR/AcrR family transcriptional regulator C-terminal domain-containing protein [Myxococcota bacterium]|nr:TetR/AcrR family transcriptional regulator C-terminal domain-containing protein [Myxococcota bacterium]